MHWRHIKTCVLCGLICSAQISAPDAYSQEYNPSRGEQELIDRILKEASELDSVKVEAKIDDSVPSGPMVNLLPIVGYNTDLGFRLGASLNLDDYGRNPSLFPDSRQKFFMETSYFTKGRAVLQAEYESHYLIPGIRFYAALAYQSDPLYHFYGFGGDIVEYDWEKDCRNDMAYYSFNRRMGSLQTYFRGHVTEHLNWTAGLSIWYFNTSDTSFRQFDGSYSIYHFYREYGIIGDDEVEGGSMEFKAGLCWDNRDYEISPSRGIFADASVNFSPDIFRTGYKYAKLAVHFRHYITPGPDWLTLAYHLAYQGTIAGKAPFYIQQNIYSNAFRQSFEEGLGGCGTLRGILSGRLVGDGYAWGNLEARIRILQFDLAGTNCYMAVNPFYDMGAIVQPYKIEEISKATGESIEALRERALRLHQSAGLGLKFGMDRNYLISLEVAKAFNSNDGHPIGFATAINYIF